MMVHFYFYWQITIEAEEGLAGGVHNIAIDEITTQNEKCKSSNIFIELFLQSNLHINFAKAASAIYLGLISSVKIICNR